MLMLTPDARQHLTQALAIDEGFRDKAYLDTTGHLTIGYGVNVESEAMPEPVARLWMETKVMQIEVSLWNRFPGYVELCEPRKTVLINMAYNCGTDGLLRFHKMILALQAKNYDDAAQEIINSEIALNRAKRLADIMRTGAWI